MLNANVLLRKRSPLKSILKSIFKSVLKSILKFVLKSILKCIRSPPSRPSAIRRMKPKIVCVAAILSGLIVVAVGFPVEGDPDALDNYDILPDVNATTNASAAVATTTASMLPHSADASKGSSEDPLDKILKVLQILLGVAAFCVIIGASVWAAKRGEAVDLENGWAGTVVRVLLRARDGVASFEKEERLVVRSGI